jgi:hypothetical protein
MLLHILLRDEVLLYFILHIGVVKIEFDLQKIGKLKRLSYSLYRPGAESSGFPQTGPAVFLFFSSIEPSRGPTPLALWPSCLAGFRWPLTQIQLAC